MAYPQGAHGPFRGVPDEPVDYDDFRTGLSFQQVRDILDGEADRKYRRGEYMFITRATVLGRWNEIKRRMYESYLRAFEKEQARDDGLPF